LTDLDDPQDPPPLSPLHRRWARRLRTVAGVRAELVKLYGESREGQVDPQDATRLAHLLGMLVRIAETAEFEQRIAALEQQAAEADRQHRRLNGHHFHHRPSP
jgi:hypothetical protein